MEIRKYFSLFRTSAGRAVGIFSILVIIAAFVPIAEGVPMQATVVVENNRRPVQPSLSGRISKVNVFEGKLVETGDVLIELDQVVQDSAAEIGRNSLEVGRRQLAAVDERISGLLHSLELRKAEQRLQRDQIKKVEPLVKRGYVAEIDLIQLEKGDISLSLAIQDITSQLEMSREDKKRLEKEANSASERLKISQNDLDNTLIRATAAGHITNLQTKAPGAYIQAGQIVAEIVPIGETLVLTSQLAPTYIDRVKSGDDAEIRFTGFRNIPSLVLSGKLKQISKDAIPDKSGLHWYSVTTVISDVAFTRNIRDQMMAGMQAQVVVHIGSRTILQYILHPLLRRLSASMVES